jgi:serine/threonine protein kinase/tetratricopeptide (TPR) repeat protein
MGVVYKAEDLELGRFVALKVLPEELARDAQALERFRWEARAISSLNHPNICTLHEIGRHDELSFLVMEPLDGTTLKHRMAGRPLDNEAFISLAAEMADALDAAHAKGIIHRDISRRISSSQRAPREILDFGLAKVDPPRGFPSGSDNTATPTVDLDGPLTAFGSVMGTVSHMSPEQARALPLDARTDLFSLGVVLYEMGTGQLPFHGNSLAMVWDAILNHAPTPPARLNPDLPVELERIIHKCLEKDRSLRYQHAADIRADLQRLKRDSQSTPRVSAAPRRARTRFARLGTMIALAAGVLAVLAGVRFLPRRTPQLTSKDTIVLADFTNTTGDPVFDETLRQGLAVELRQSPFLSLVSEDRIQQLLRLMSRPPDARLTHDVAQEICERTASAAVLTGSIDSLGSEYVIGLRAKSCRDGSTLDEEQAQAARKEDVLNALSGIARTFRTRIGESLATVAQHSTPLEDATTPSLEALKAYSAGVKTSLARGSAAGVPFLKRSLEIDPRFAMAHALLSRIYGDVGESVLSAESARKAYVLRDRASDRERFFITFTYELQVTGNLEKAQQSAELWAQTYPRDPNADALLSGYVCQGSGQFEKSVEAATKAIAIDPDFVFGYANLAWGSMYVDRLDDADETLRRAAQRGLEISELLLARYCLAFLKGDAPGLDRAMAQSRDVAGANDLIYHAQAFALAGTGHLRLARAASRRAVSLAHETASERAATYEVGAAVMEALFGNSVEATRSVDAALGLSKGRDVEYGAAVALAVSGDSSRSEALARDIERRFPDDSTARFNYLPRLRGLSALSHGKPAEAIEQLQAAGPYEMAVPASSFTAFFGALYPTYVRGAAELAAHRGNEAAAEFKKILDHRGRVIFDPIGVLARLQLGRALALAGDTPRAEAAYRDFLELWKDADAEIPILQQAKAEYARLR